MCNCLERVKHALDDICARNCEKLNKREAKKIHPGALVRYSFSTPGNGAQKAIVIAKEYQQGTRYESILCQEKEDRYMLTISWLAECDIPDSRFRQDPGTIETVSHWDLMVISHARNSH